MTNAARLEAIDKLIEAVDRGERAFMIDFCTPFNFSGNQGDFAFIGLDAYNGSLDAALSLHNALLPEWGWEVASSDAAAVFFGNEFHGPAELASADSPARALLLAILKAYRAQVAQQTA